MVSKKMRVKKSSPLTLVFRYSLSSLLSLSDNLQSSVVVYSFEFSFVVESIEI
jgi:hypothetical protein